MFACLWWLIGTAVQVSTKGVGSLIAGRVLNGVCVGITSSQVPVYLAEIAKRVSGKFMPSLGTYLTVIGISRAYHHHSTTRY